MATYIMLFIAIASLGSFLNVLKINTKILNIIMSICVIISFTIIIGFRGVYVGADTYSYLSECLYVAETPLQYMDWEMSEPGYLLLLKLFSFIDADSRFMLVACAFVTQLLLAHFYFKYCKNRCIFVFGWLVYLGFVFPFTVTGVRQSLAMVVGLHSIIYLMERSYAKYIITILLAMSFHYTSAVYFILLFGKFIVDRTIRYKTLFFIALIISVMFEYVVPSVIQVLPGYRQYFDFYVNTEVSISAYIKVILYSLIFWLNVYLIKKNENDEYRLFLVFELTLIFLALIGNKYFQINRIGYYFSSFLPIILTILLKNIRYDKYIKAVCSALSFSLMVYTIYYGTNYIYPYYSIIDI